MLRFPVDLDPVQADIDQLQADMAGKLGTAEFDPVGTVLWTGSIYTYTLDSLSDFGPGIYSIYMETGGAGQHGGLFTLRDTSIDTDVITRVSNGSSQLYVWLIGYAGGDTSVTAYRQDSDGNSQFHDIQKIVKHASL